MPPQITAGLLSEVTRFRPDLISPGALILYLNPALGVTKDSSNKVSAWDSQMITAQAVQSTSGNQPLWVANSTLNYPSVRFDGSASYMDLPAIYPGGYSFAKGLTMMAAILKQSGSDRRFILPRGTAGTAGPMLASGYSSADTLGAVSENQGVTANSANDGGTTADGAYRVIAGRWDGANTECWANGVKQNTTPLNSPNVTVALNNTNIWTLGACFFAGSPANYFNGDILLLCAWNVNLTDAQMAAAFRGFQLFNQYNA